MISTKASEPPCHVDAPLMPFSRDTEAQTGSVPSLGQGQGVQLHGNPDEQAPESMLLTSAAFPAKQSGWSTVRSGSKNGTREHLHSAQPEAHLQSCHAVCGEMKWDLF